MMGKHEVHAAAVYIEALAEIFLAHGRALEVPAWEAFAPNSTTLELQLLEMVIAVSCVCV